MDVRQLQIAINARDWKPPLVADGIPGRLTTKAIDSIVSGVVGSKIENWSDARRMAALEQIIYRDADIEVGAIDGLVGEQTRYAREVYAARSRGDKTVETWRDAENKTAIYLSSKKPSLSADNFPTQSGVTAFYGSVGTNQTIIALPFPFRIAWDLADTVQRTSCHAKVATPMKNIWQRMLDHYGYDQIKALRLDVFGGCLNPRLMRGSKTQWSMHSWGIAWDVDPDRNQYKWGRDKATMDEAAYKPFWDIVYDEGAISLGIERNFDWMHFQFARL